MARNGPDEPPAWRSFLARHRRTFLKAYLSGIALIVVCFAVAPLRQRVLLGVEAAVDAWEARWTPRVEHGEALVAAGRYEEAVDYLTRLDRSFPARDVRHARDRERERILRALGRAHAALDHQGRSLEAFGRAVRFDPLNYRNRLALARAAMQFDETEIALEQYRGILAFRPSHLPSLVEVVAQGYDDGDYAGVVRRFEDYLDAFVVHHLVVRAGEAADTVPVTVDGRFHDVVARFDRPTGPITTVHLEPGPYAAELRRLVLEGGVELGRAEGRLPTASIAGIRREGSPVLRSRRAVDAFPTGETVGSRPPRPVLDVPSTDAPATTARARLEIRLLKPIEASTWKLVEASYRNVLDFEGLEAARRRTRLEPPGPVLPEDEPAAGDVSAGGTERPGRTGSR